MENFGGVWGECARGWQGSSEQRLQGPLKKGWGETASLKAATFVPLSLFLPYRMLGQGVKEFESQSKLGNAQEVRA